jgi:DNA-binding SARP family transcriptional activator
MELYWSMGQRQQAINLFQHLTAVLAGDYGVRPSPETVALYERFGGE